MERAPISRLRTVLAPTQAGGGETFALGLAAQGPAAARATVNDYFRLWDYGGTLDRIQHTLYVKCRELARRKGQDDVGGRLWR